MNRRAYYYIVVASTLAAVVLFAHDWSRLFQLPGDDILGLGVLVALSILAEALAVQIAIVDSKGSIRSSLGFLPLLTSAIVFVPEASITAAIVIDTVTETAIAKVRAIWKVFANISHSILSISLGMWIYRLLGGTHGAPFNVDILAFLGLTTSFFLTNMLFISIFFTLRKGSNFFEVFRQVSGPGGINFLYGVLASPIAVFAAFLYDRMYVGGVLLIILPIFLIRYSYLSKIQLQQSNRDLLRVLIKTIETRDPYTSGHSLRVSRLAKLIAEEIGCSRRQVEIIETAGLLHDIGKIDSIYAEIIQKRGILTEEEHRVIKTHAVKGAELLQNLTSFPDEVIRGVRHHHERYDGKGYPDGLVGKDIPIASRVIMLCDSIDAMLSDRPYRSAMTVEQVAEEIQRCAGSQFDPEIVEVVLRKGTLAKAAAQIREESPLDLVGA